MADVVDQLIIRDLASEALNKAREAAQKAEEQLRKTIEAARALGTVNVQTDASVRAAATNLAGANKHLTDSEKAFRAAGGGSRDMGRAVLEGSRALEDLQYGIAGVLNNLPGLISSLGGGAGLAGIVSVAAVAAVQLYKHWDDIAEVFGQSKTETEAEAMDRLSKATSLTADETERLVKHKREQAALSALESSQPKAVAEAAKAAAEAVPELPEGFKGLVDDLVKSRNPQGLDGLLSQEQRDRILAGGRGQTDTGFTPPSAAEIQAQRAKELATVRDAEEKRAQKDIARAVADPEQLRGLLNELRRAGQGEKADELERRVAEGTPEAKARKSLEDEQAKKQIDAREQQIKDEERRAKDLAKNIGPALDVEALSTGQTVDRDRVKKALEETQGMSGAGADAAADAVLGEFYRNLNERIQAKAGKEGISEQEAGYRLLEEDQNRENDKRKQERDKQKRDEDKVLKESVDYERRDKSSDILAKAAASGGLDPQMIKQFLIAQGIDPAAAGFEAKEAFTAEGRERLQASLTPEKPRQSETFGLEGLLSAIQGGIGGADDTPAKQLKATEEMRDLLRQFAQRPDGLSFSFR